MTTQENASAERKEAISVLARGTCEELANAVARFGSVGRCEDLKSPEVGLVMVRGRIGGDGAAFNAGEATMVRAVIRVDGKYTGFGARLGRDTDAVRNAAILDALWQQPGFRSDIERAVLEPIRQRLRRSAADAASAAASTRVEFFTMARETE